MRDWIVGRYPHQSRGQREELGRFATRREALAFAERHAARHGSPIEAGHRFPGGDFAVHLWSGATEDGRWRYDVWHAQLAGMPPPLSQPQPPAHA